MLVEEQGKLWAESYDVPSQFAMNWPTFLSMSLERQEYVHVYMTSSATVIGERIGWMFGVRVVLATSLPDDVVELEYLDPVFRSHRPARHVHRWDMGSPHHGRSRGCEMPACVVRKVMEE